MDKQYIEWFSLAWLLSMINYRASSHMTIAPLSVERRGMNEK